MRIVSHVRQAAKSVPESLRQQWAATGVNVEKLQVESKISETIFILEG